MAREGIEPPTRGFQFFKAENRGPRPTVQVLSLRHLRDDVLSRVVCSSPEYGHRFGERCPAPHRPPSTFQGRRLYKSRVLVARSYISQDVRGRGASRTRIKAEGCLSKNLQVPQGGTSGYRRSPRSRRHADPVPLATIWERLRPGGRRGHRLEVPRHGKRRRKCTAIARSTSQDLVGNSRYFFSLDTLLPRPLVTQMSAP
jgi:hypothetical protein